MTSRWRLLETGAGSPAWNMALDEALLLRFREGDIPLLRLYRWKPGALSIGRFQKLSDLAHVPAEIPRVRRLTGGGALHHREDELTYSIVAPYSALPGGKRAGPKAAYHAVHAAIARGLATMGLSLVSREETTSPRSHGGTDTASSVTPCLRGESPSVAESAALCYDRATDFDLKASEGRKLVGSAQRRSGAAFLQHGAIPFSRDPHSRGAISLEELLGRLPQADEVATALERGFERALEVELEPSAPREDELDLARRLERERYASRAWTEERP